MSPIWANNNFSINGNETLGSHNHIKCMHFGIVDALTNSWIFYVFCAAYFEFKECSYFSQMLENAFVNGQQFAPNSPFSVCSLLADLKERYNMDASFRLFNSKKRRQFHVVHVIRNEWYKQLCSLDLGIGPSVFSSRDCVETFDAFIQSAGM